MTTVYALRRLIKLSFACTSWKSIVLPLVQPLSDHLASLPVSDNPNAFIFPRAASAKRTASLSGYSRCRRTC